MTATVTVNGATREIIWYYVTPGQLGGVLPSNTPVGTGTLTVTNSTGTSAPASIKVVESAFGTISLDGSWNRPGGSLQLELASCRQPTLPAPARRLSSSEVARSHQRAMIPFRRVLRISGRPIIDPDRRAERKRAVSRQEHIRGTRPDQCGCTSGVTLGCSVPVIVTQVGYSSNVTTIPIAANGRTMPSSVRRLSEGTEISQAEINSWIAAGQYPRRLGRTHSPVELHHLRQPTAAARPQQVGDQK